MARVINTQFDNPLEEDIALESVDSQNVVDTLKNAENVYKSFLYLRKMYSYFPAKETIRSMGNVSSTDFVQISIPENCNYATIENFGTATASVKINGMEYIMNPGSKSRFPIVAPDPNAVPAVAGDLLELKGDVSYMIADIQEY